MWEYMFKWGDECGMAAHVNVSYRFQNDVSLSKHTSTSKTWNEHLIPKENVLSHCCEATGIVLCRLGQEGSRACRDKEEWTPQCTS